MKPAEFLLVVFLSWELSQALPVLSVCPVQPSPCLSAAQWMHRGCCQMSTGLPPQPRALTQSDISQSDISQSDISLSARFPAAPARLELNLGFSEWLQELSGSFHG